MLPGCSQDSRSHTRVASRKRDRREGRDRQGRGQTDLGCGTEGCSLSTFAPTVNMNVGQYRESECCSHHRPPATGQGLTLRARCQAPSPGPSLSLVCTLVNWVGRSPFGFFPRLFQKEGLFSSDAPMGLDLVINLPQNTGSFIVFLPGIYVLNTGDDDEHTTKVWRCCR